MRAFLKREVVGCVRSEERLVAKDAEGMKSSPAAERDLFKEPRGTAFVDPYCRFWITHSL